MARGDRQLVDGFERKREPQSIDECCADIRRAIEDMCRMQGRVFGNMTIFLKVKENCPRCMEAHARRLGPPRD
ncbi:hypothetical protein ACFL09_05220 [Planctomycetota bacterium]